MGDDWQLTQRQGGYQCTELAHRYWMFKFKVNWTPRGNAGSWCDTPPPANIGVVQSTMPVHGDLMVLAPGSCGAAEATGHVTVVDTFDAASGRLTVLEQNRARRGTYQLSCAKCFLHIVANDGTSDAGAAPPAPDASVTPRDGGQLPTEAGASDASVGAQRPVGRDAGVPASEPSPPIALPDAQVQPADAATSTVTSPAEPTAPQATDDPADEGGGCSLAAQPGSGAARDLGLILLAIALIRRRRNRAA